MKSVDVSAMNWFVHSFMNWTTINEWNQHKSNPIIEWNSTNQANASNRAAELRWIDVIKSNQHQAAVIITVQLLEQEYTCCL